MVRDQGKGQLRVGGDQRAQQRQQAFLALAGQRGGDFIQQDRRRLIDKDRAAKGQQLLGFQRQIAHAAVGARAQAKLRDQVRGAPPRFRRRQEIQRPRRVTAHEQVVRDRKIGGESRFLRHQRDAKAAGARRAGGRGGQRAAGGDDLAVAGRQQARHHRHQNRFPRAVLADQPVDLALADVEIDRVHRQNARETARYRARCETQRGVERHGSSCPDRAFAT